MPIERNKAEVIEQARQIIIYAADLIRAIQHDDDTYIVNNLVRIREARYEALRTVQNWKPELHVWA